MLCVCSAACSESEAADSASKAGADTAALHVPSPEWQDQIIYFAMIDRFDDGDPSNNDQGQGEYAPQDGRKFSGGDLVGLTRRLDYIAGLGATALWITPPVANQWWNTRAQYGGYHGYWASDFKSVDAHFGSLDDYRALSSSLHGRGMLLIQDVVVNHVADYFHYSSWRADAPADGFHLQPDGGGHSAPAQPPFSHNDARHKHQRLEAIYHWTPHIANLQDREQELNFQLADLDDLNTENPTVRRALRDAYGYWIREVGVDGFRVDTAFYVPPEYFADFIWNKDPKALGMAQVAAQTGRNDFLLFGEGFAIDRAFEDSQMRKIDAYMRDESGRRFLPSMIQFPLYGTLGDVFARGHATDELADRIERTLVVHAEPHRMPSFIDNHDVDRFLASGSEAGLRQALLAIMTLPGIPTIYMGTEQGFRAQRASLFANGWGSGGRDHFDTDHPLYRTIQQQSALRRAEPALRRGTPSVVAHQGSGPGLIAWRMDYEGESLLVAFNTASHALLADRIELGSDADELELRYSLLGDTPSLQHVAPAQISVQLPARAAYVWKLHNADTTASSTSPDSAAADHPLRIDCDTGTTTLRGRAAANQSALIVVDGALDRALPVRASAEGAWQTSVDRSDWLRPGTQHRVVAWDPQARQASNPCLFNADPFWTVRLHQRDTAGDDRGPDGTYVYPKDATWQGHRTLDIRGVTLRSYGTALQLDVEMADLVALWNPAQGFDHLALTAYLSIPGHDSGSSLLPLQHASAPAGFTWQRRLRVGGWSNSLTSNDGASADHEGQPQPVGAQLERLDDGRTLRMTFPPASLGWPRTLDGLAVYLTSWDYDAGYRALAAEPVGHTFGGGAADAPRVMDDTAVLELRL
ncbi:MAG: hypothetical protein KDJ14_02830 [Xanthomonadales bacterium]|nr:hypothetical protein [Xanthomonadales bacterium]